ncbi:MAG TPA: hypothetical protein VM165_11285 [Planctomycetaceae bacterium]|nr:hypothetical protein [Planctomycetaceae bacterium]
MMSTTAPPNPEPDWWQADHVFVVMDINPATNLIYLRDPFNADPDPIQASITGWFMDHTKRFIICN